MNNLLIAFPEKTEKERLKIAKQFYLNFVDTFIESIKLFFEWANILKITIFANKMIWFCTKIKTIYSIY